MKNVCVITTAHPAEDNRIYRKEIQTLLKLYKVFYITTGDTENVASNLNIINVGYFSGSFKKRASANWNAFREALRLDVDLYHFHDFDFIFLAVLLKIIKGKPIIYDVHEDYPSVVRSRDYVKNGVILGILSVLVNLVESFCSLFFDGALVVSETIENRISKHISRTYILPNYPKGSEFEGIRKGAGEKTIVHLGNLNKVRGAEIIFEALEQSKNDYVLKVVGGIYPESYEKYLAKKFPRVSFEVTGKLPYKEALEIAENGSVGIISYLPVPNHIDASPNKIFEYMALGLPIISSDLAPFRKVIGDSGVLYKADDPKDLVRAIKEISDASLQKNFSENGRKQFKKLYNWEKVSNNLSGLYEEIIGK